MAGFFGGGGLGVWPGVESGMGSGFSCWCWRWLFLIVCGFFLLGFLRRSSTVKRERNGDRRRLDRAGGRLGRLEDGEDIVCCLVVCFIRHIILLFSISLCTFCIGR